MLWFLKQKNDFGTTIQLYICIVFQFEIVLFLLPEFNRTIEVTKQIFI